MCLLQIIYQIAAILANGAVILGVYIALNSWRNEYFGKKKIELAENTLILFYKASDIIHFLRHPLAYESETEKIKINEKESKEEYRARKNASVLLYRYNQHSDLFNEIHATRYRFMVQFGKDKIKPFDDLRKITVDLIASAKTLAMLWPIKQFSTEEKREDHIKNVKKYEAIFWEGRQKNDQINKRLDEVISQIEQICYKIIGSKNK